MAGLEKRMHMVMFRKVAGVVNSASILLLTNFSFEIPKYLIERLFLPIIFLIFQKSDIFCSIKKTLHFDYLIHGYLKIMIKPIN